VSKDEYLALRKEMEKALQSQKCRDFIDRLIVVGLTHEQESAVAFSSCRSICPSELGMRSQLATNKKGWAQVESQPFVLRVTE